MSFKVFLSYGAGADEQVAAWRLQTLATSYGMHVSVPNRNGAGKAVGEQVRRAIDRSNCVLAIITGNLGPAVAGELNYALSKGKLIVQVVREDITVPPALSGLPLFRFSPLSTGQVEADVVKFLHEQRLGKEKTQTIGALVAIGLGLFLLAALSKKQYCGSRLPTAPV
jgi:hypothetical protein